MTSPIDPIFREDAPRVGDRGFGLTVGGVLGIFGCIRVALALRAGATAPVDVAATCLWAAGGGLIVLALARPDWLAVPNLLWFRLGLLLARVVNPVVLFLLYATCVVPIGLVMRAFGHDPLRLRPREAPDTWWAAHEPSPVEEPWRRQF